MKTTTLELEEEARLHTEGDPEAPPETSVKDADVVGNGQPNRLEHEEIERLAYEHWQSRGCPYGSPEIDWYWAEEQSRAE